MTFDQYLQERHSKGYAGTDDNMSDAFDKWLTELDVDTIIAFAELWHANELKSMRTKGANTTNSKYSKEERSEWAKKGGRPRKPVDNSNTTNK